MARIGQAERALLAAPKPRGLWVLLAALGFLLSSWWLFDFTVDDALISVRYARHLAEGKGYRFNAGGPATDGVTPLPWPFLLFPLAHGAPWDVLHRAKLFGWVSSLLAVGLVGWDLGGRKEGAPWTKALPLGALVFGAPLAAHGVSGMETGLATLAATLACLAVGREGAWGPWLAGATATLRPEMVPWAWVLALGPHLPLRTADRRAGVALGKALVAASLPFVAIALVRGWVFGRGAPLAVWAKASDAFVGARYVAVACLLSGLPVALLDPRGLLRSSKEAQVVVAAAGTHLLTVALVGGDWMPYGRLLVPVLPSMALGAQAVLAEGKGVVPILRGGLSLLLAVFHLATGGERGRHVGEDRRALSEKARPFLEGKQVVAVLDIGWPSTVTEASLVDLAGVTDPYVAFRPGGHTSKRLDVGFLLERGTQVFLVYAEDPDGTAEANPGNVHRFPRRVEARLMASPLAERHFVRRAYLPLGSTGFGYLVLERRGPGDGPPKEEAHGVHSEESPAFLEESF